MQPSSLIPAETGIWEEPSQHPGEAQGLVLSGRPLLEEGEAHSFLLSSQSPRDRKRTAVHLHGPERKRIACLPA